MSDPQEQPDVDVKAFSGDFLIWRKVPNGNLRKVSAGNPKFRHKTMDSAVTEAKRLAGLFPESVFVILQEIAAVKPVKQPEEAKEAEHVE